VKDKWACGYDADIPEIMDKIQRRQLLHEGDRSHVFIFQVLFYMTQGLTYDGREKDIADIERDWASGDMTPEDLFEEKEKMFRKQQLHNGDRPVVLQKLDEVVKQGLTFPGWERVVKRIENDWIEGSEIKDYDFEEVEEKESEYTETNRKRLQKMHKKDTEDNRMQLESLFKSSTDGRSWMN